MAKASHQKPNWQRNLGYGLLKGFMGLAFRMLIFGVALGSIAMFGKSMLYHAYTPDLPWIAATGHYILQTGVIPTHDIFSWTLSDKPWVVYQWLFEVLVAFVQRTVGSQLMVKLFTVFVAILYVFIPLFLHQRKKIPLMFTMLISTSALFIAAINMSLRPMAVTALFLLLQYVVLDALRRNKISFRGTAVILAVIYVLWGNMHTGVIMGFFSFGLMLLGDLLQTTGVYRFHPPDDEIEGHPLELSSYGILIAIGFLTSLINPYGWGIYTYLADLSSSKYLNNLIVELQSPNFHYLNYWYFAALFSIFIFLMSRMREVFPAYVMLHLFVFTMATLFVQRFVVWACLFYALMLPIALYQWWCLHTKSNGVFAQTLRDTVERFNIYRPLFWVICGLVLLVFFWVPPHKKFQNALRPHLGSCEGLVPGIRKYQTKLKLPTDKAFVLPEVGSCLLGQFPNEKVFMDTRFDFYGEEYTKAGREAAEGNPSWKKLFKRWGVNTVIINKDWQLSNVLLNNGYTVIYRDRSLIILRESVEEAKHKKKRSV